MFKVFVWLADGASELFGALAAWLLFPLVFVMCVEMFSRYVLGAPTTWSYELAYMMTAANYLLAFALVLKLDGNMRVDILYLMMSKRVQRLIDVITFVFIITPFMLLVIPSLNEYLVRAWMTGEGTGQSSWNPPIWPFRLIYMISFVLLFGQALAELYKRVWLLIHPPEDEGDSE